MFSLIWWREPQAPLTYKSDNTKYPRDCHILFSEQKAWRNGVDISGLFRAIRMNHSAAAKQNGNLERRRKSEDILLAFHVRQKPTENLSTCSAQSVGGGICSEGSKRGHGLRTLALVVDASVLGGDGINPYSKYSMTRGITPLYDEFFHLYFLEQKCGDHAVPIMRVE